MWNSILFMVPVLILFGFSLCTNGDRVIRMEDLNALCDIKHGDVDIAFLSPVAKPRNDGTCSDQIWNPYGVQMVFRYAINEVNKRLDILPNITLGYIIMDNCMTDVVSLARALSFVTEEENLQNTHVMDENNITFSKNDAVHSEKPKSMQGKHNNLCMKEEIPLFDNAAGLVGPYSSRSSVMVASLLSLFEIPTLATLATSDELTDASRFRWAMSSQKSPKGLVIVYGKGEQSQKCIKKC